MSFYFGFALVKLHANRASYGRRCWGPSYGGCRKVGSKKIAGEFRRRASQASIRSDGKAGSRQTEAIVSKSVATFHKSYVGYAAGRSKSAGVFGGVFGQTLARHHVHFVGGYEVGIVNMVSGITFGTRRLDLML